MVWGHPGHWGAGPHPLEASSTALSPVMMIKNVCRPQGALGASSPLGERAQSTGAVMETPGGRTLNKGFPGCLWFWSKALLLSLGKSGFLWCSAGVGGALPFYVNEP